MKNYKKRHPMNNKGQMMIVQLLFLFMTIAVMVAVIPALKTVLDIAQQSDNLNCKGFVDTDSTDGNYSYNGSLPTNTTACLSIKLYLPYIILVVLIGGVTKLLYGQSAAGGYQQGY